MAERSAAMINAIMGMMSPKAQRGLILAEKTQMESEIEKSIVDRGENYRHLPSEFAFTYEEQYLEQLEPLLAFDIKFILARVPDALILVYREKAYYASKKDYDVRQICKAGKSGSADDFQYSDVETVDFLDVNDVPCYIFSHASHRLNKSVTLPMSTHFEKRYGNMYREFPKGWGF